MKTIKHLSYNLAGAILSGEVEKDMWNGKEQNGLWKGRCFNNASSSGSFRCLNLNLLIYLKKVRWRERMLFYREKEYTHICLLEVANACLKAMIKIKKQQQKKNDYNLKFA